ncbi:MAG: hypothetical protein ACE5D2_06415 [Fidelibacterota bacterium]
MITKRNLLILSGFALIWQTACSAPPSVAPEAVFTEPDPATGIQKETIRPQVRLKSLPTGWVLDRQPIAKWGMSLPTVLSTVPDSAQSIEYWDDIQSLPIGVRLAVKRAKVFYQVITRLTIETIELQFVNVNYVYSASNYEPSHYILEDVIRTTELKPTGFPQLTADDVLKYKILMEYGTPKDFDGVYHQYTDSKTEMKVRVIDDLHIQVQLHSKTVEKQMQQAINEMYSEEGIEYQKKQLLQGIDL